MDGISTHSGIENGDNRLIPWSIGFREAISSSSAIHGWWTAWISLWRAKAGWLVGRGDIGWLMGRGGVVKKQDVEG